jgi:hypothetical protein
MFVASKAEPVDAGAVVVALAAPGVVGVETFTASALGTNAPFVTTKPSTKAKKAHPGPFPVSHCSEIYCNNTESWVCCRSADFEHQILKLALYRRIPLRHNRKYGAI